jgi:hypothetical protein
MIKHWRQRFRDVIIGHDGDLIANAKVKLHTVGEVKTAEHNTRANKELVSVSANTARPPFMCASLAFER